MDRERRSVNTAKNHDYAVIQVFRIIVTDCLQKLVSYSDILLALHGCRTHALFYSPMSDSASDLYSLLLRAVRSPVIWVIRVASAALDSHSRSEGFHRKATNLKQPGRTSC